MRGISASRSVSLKEVEDTGQGWEGGRCDCGSPLSAPKPDHDSSGNSAPGKSETLGRFVLSTQIAGTIHAEWKRGVRDQRQGTGLKGRGQQWSFTERMEEQIQERIWRESAH